MQVIDFRNCPMHLTSALLCTPWIFQLQPILLEERIKKKKKLAILLYITHQTITKEAKM